MILVIDANGNLLDMTPEDIYQGSNDANKIQIVAPFSANVLVYGKFKTPVMTSSEYQFTKTIGISATQNLWELELPLAVTQYHGIVELQLKAVNGTQTIVTTRINFKIKKGIPVDLPATPTQSVYDTILQNITALSGQLINKQDKYDETLTTTSKYVVGAINELKTRIDALTPNENE